MKSGAVENVWCAVADELPEPGAVVLVYAKWKRGGRVSTGYFVTGIIWCVDGTSGCGVPVPTHWMPLPEPPK